MSCDEIGQITHGADEADEKRRFTLYSLTEVCFTLQPSAGSLKYKRFFIKTYR